MATLAALAHGALLLLLAAHGSARVAEVPETSVDSSGADTDFASLIYPLLKHNDKAHEESLPKVTNIELPLNHRKEGKPLALIIAGDSKQHLKRKLVNNVKKYLKKYADSAEDSPADLDIVHLEDFLSKEDHELNDADDDVNDTKSSLASFEEEGPLDVDVKDEVQDLNEDEQKEDVLDEEADEKVNEDAEPAPEYDESLVDLNLIALPSAELKHNLEELAVLAIQAHRDADEEEELKGLGVEDVIGIIDSTESRRKHNDGLANTNKNYNLSFMFNR